MTNKSLYTSTFIYSKYKIVKIKKYSPVSHNIFQLRKWGVEFLMLSIWWDHKKKRKSTDRQSTITQNTAGPQRPFAVCHHNRMCTGAENVDEIGRRDCDSVEF